MFDITPEDINQLNDVDLRELVGRLCEAELISRGLSPAAVTWGGNQTAADGGLDVRVALPPDVAIEGFIPRTSTGFQVKKPDMPRAEIITEMRPAGTIRPVIQDLVDEAGAYIIVSSTGSTADSALRNRRNALREALSGVSNADQLRTDFYDRTRLATWVRCHPGLITWVRERVGRALVGWHPYKAWSGAAEGVDAEYLLDDKMRLHLGKHRDTPGQTVTQAIDELRDELALPGKIVRLVGLSGVGKTRLVQALFDVRIGSRALPPSLAVYTNLSDNPDPQPTGLASDLIANRTRAVLIVDNCPPDLHRRLSDLCSGQASTVSVLTVEYDVRDDQPEGTQVVTLETSSPELIEKLVRRRCPHLSQVDARTIAEASGGNARIAIALAETVERSDSIAGLSNDELFQRLFRQRQDPDNALLHAAQACSLVYSFQGEALEGAEAELPHLASLAGQPVTETYRHIGELLRRNLVQQRGLWRAILPHAIANRLAARALDDIPYDAINKVLIESASERLTKSFSRRLSYLHDHPKAIAIAERWLASDGFLGDVTALNDLGQAMFENISSVLPKAALAALERAGNDHPDVAVMVWYRYRSLLRSLAYDSTLFERSAQLLAWAAIQSKGEQESRDVSNIFISLFTIYLSGTHATIEQRLGVIEQAIKYGEAKAQKLGLAALNNVLKTGHFSSSYRFEFGARSRDYGSWPSGKTDITRWYGAALAFIERLALSEGVLKTELRDLLAKNLHGLWATGYFYDEIETLFRKFAAEGFWREGWIACRRAMEFGQDELEPHVSSRLSALEADLRPANILDRVRAIVLSNMSTALDLEDIDVAGDPISEIDRLDAIAQTLGMSVAADEEVFAEILPELLHGGSRTWAFGRGLAIASSDPATAWASFVEGLEGIAREQRDAQVLKGFLAGLWERDRELAQNLLDTVPDQPALRAFLPMLHPAGLDERGVERLKRALNAQQVPIHMYRALAHRRDHLAGSYLKDLLLLIANQLDGFEVALEILATRLLLDRSDKREDEPEILAAGRELLQQITFRKSRGYQDDFHLGVIVKTCLSAPDTGPIAAEVAVRLRQAVVARETYSLYHGDLLKALLGLQPVAVLNALFEGEEEDQKEAVHLFEDLGGNQNSPADAISCEALIAWCEGDRKHRYPLAASIVTFTRRPEASGPQVWSDQAQALLANTPNPRSVLAAFIKRFRPMSWSGSRAAIMEANVRLLDSLEENVSSDLTTFLSDTKSQLAQEIARERQLETEQDRARDERFE